MYNKLHDDVELTQQEQYAIDILKKAFEKDNLSFDNIKLERRSGSYLTLLCRDNKRNHDNSDYYNDFCRVKAGSLSTWVSLDVWLGDELREDYRFQNVKNSNQRHWKIQLNSVASIVNITDLIIAAYQYCTSPSDYTFVPIITTENKFDYITPTKEEIEENLSQIISSGSRIKGIKLSESVIDYTVFDLETTGLYVNSDCKIIEIAALKVRNDEVVDAFSTLINPQMHIPNSATRINHITDEMVENAPIIENIFDDFIKFLGDDILVGHNIDSFDYNIIYDLHIRLKGTPFQNRYIDTYHLSKMCFPELPSHKLTDLAEHLNIDNSEAHRAEKDCYMNLNLYKELKPLLSGENNTRTIPVKTGKSGKKYASISNRTGIQNIFKGTTCIVYGSFKTIDNDKVQNIVNELGAECVDYFCYSVNYLILGEDMYEKYVRRIPDELIDSVAFRTSARVLSERDFIYFSNMIISTESNSLDVTFSVDVSGKKICLTGEFACGDREQLGNTLTSLGAVIKGDVIKSLDYLVIGKHGSPEWKDGKGNKCIKAEYFNEKGYNIKIIKECEFIKGVE